MRTLMILLITFLLLPSSYGQTEEAVDRKTRRELLREENKRQQEIALTETATLIDWMINNQRFVLEADYLSNQYGHRVMVSSNLNFILVDSLKGTIQIAPTGGYGGPNMMGGVTADGSISQYEVKKIAKSGSYSISILIMTSLGTYDIFISVSADGSAYATIGGNWGGKLNYQGKLVPLGASRIYKARSI